MRTHRALIGLLVLVLILSACARPTPTPTPKPAPTKAAPTAVPQATAAPTAAPKKLVFAMVTDQNGLGDQGFNDSAWYGLKQAEKEFGSKPQEFESREQAQNEPNLTSLADQKVDLAVGVGFLLTDAIKEVAARYPTINFALVDSVVQAPNVANLLFKEEEGSFLVGAAAGLMTKKNIVGYVGGIEGDLLKKFEAGYKAGVMTTNPKCKVLVAYTGTFADPAKGESFANAQYDQGADIIYQVAGQTGLGVVEAAKKRNLYFIGVDKDQYSLAPKNIITSMIKRVDLAVFDACRMVAKGTFKGGMYTYGINEGGIDIAPTSDKTLPPDVLKTIEKLKEMVKKGEVKPPATEAELAKFTPPKLQ